MDSHRTCPRLVAVALGTAVLVSGCSRSRAPADTLTSGTLLRDTTLYTSMTRERGPSVFTDTALFRQLCAEADSGLTARTARKCTPRDQSLKLFLPPRRDP